MGCENDFIQCNNKELTWEDLVRLGVGLTTGGKPAMRVMGLASGPPPCVDTAVDFTGDPELDAMVSWPSTPEQGKWWMPVFSPIVSGSILFDGAAVVITRGTADDGGGGFNYFTFYTFDGVSAFSPVIDSTVDQTLTIQFAADTERSGKVMVVTLYDRANDKYIQLDLSTKPYGTWTQVITPVEWTAGPAPGDSTFWNSAEGDIAVFVSYDNTTGGGSDDDWRIEAVHLTHIECI